MAEDISENLFWELFRICITFFWIIYVVTNLSPLCSCYNVRKVAECYFKQSLPDTVVHQLGHTILRQKSCASVIKWGILSCGLHTVTLKALQKTVQSMFHQRLFFRGEHFFGCVSTSFCHFKGSLPCSQMCAHCGWKSERQINQEFQVKTPQSWELCGRPELIFFIPSKMQSRPFQGEA